MIRESRPVRRLLVALIFGLLLLCIGPLSIGSAKAAASANGTTIEVNGKAVKMNGPVFVFKDRTYVPAARIAKLFGAQATWDNVNEELTIHTALNDTIVLGNGVPVVYFNEGRYQMDAYPFLKGERLYMPLRELSEILHVSMDTNASTNTVNLTTVKPEVVSETSGLAEISKAYGVSTTELLKRNELGSQAEIKSGTKLKVVIPSFLDKAAKPYTESELLLLAKITMVEAGYEPFEGQLALANVILNRVKDTRFPDSIHDVIYSGRQFPPAHNGLLDKSQPNASSLRAAKAALNGRNNVGNAVYFYNPAVSTGAYWSSLDAVVTIGHHCFAK